MRVIKLKKLEKTKRSGELEYSPLIELILNTPPKNQQGQAVGFTPAEVRKVGKVLDILEESKDTLTLEDSDYRILKKAVDDFRFGIASKNLREFLDDIDDAEQVSVKDIKK